MNDQYSIAKERGMIGSNGKVDLSTINHRTDILPVETETVDVQPDIPQTGNLSVDTIDFSRISRSSAGAAGMQFISSDRILKQYWGDNGNLTYNVREDGTVEIREGGEIIGFTDEQGIRNAIGSSKATADTSNVSTTNKVGEGPSDIAQREQARAQSQVNNTAPNTATADTKNVSTTNNVGEGPSDIAQREQARAQSQAGNVAQKSAMAGDPRFDAPQPEQKSAMAGDPRFNAASTQQSVASTGATATATVASNGNLSDQGYPSSKDGMMNPDTARGSVYAKQQDVVNKQIIADYKENQNQMATDALKNRSTMIADSQDPKLVQEKEMIDKILASNGTPNAVSAGVVSHNTIKASNTPSTPQPSQTIQASTPTQTVSTPIQTSSTSPASQPTGEIPSESIEITPENIEELSRISIDNFYNGDRIL